MRRYLVGLGILWLLASSVLSGWLLYSRFSQTNEARRHNAQVWHAVICQIEHAVVANPKLTPSQKDGAVAFYDRLLTEDVHTTGCEIAPRR